MYVDKKMLYQMSKFPRWLDYKNRHTDERQKLIDHHKLESSVGTEAIFDIVSLCRALKGR